VGVLDDPALYYAPPQEDWSLGDIVIAPTAVLWSAVERQAGPYPQPAPPPDGSTSITYQLWVEPGMLPMPAIECWLTPAVIVVDDCVIDKDFNVQVEQRIREGVPVEEAEAEARADLSLDPLVPVTPILPYGRARSLNPQAVRQAQAVGYFPILDWPGMVDEGYLDFTLTVPVSRQLLWGPAAALSDPARRILRWKLAQFYAVRNFSVDAEITRAVGRTITEVRVVADQKDRLVVDLELDGGEAELRLRQEPRRSAIPPGHQRGRPN
jgi:hypothetical protein